MTSYSMIPLSSIDTGARLRAADPAWVAFLAEEIAADGQIEPIRVVIRGNGYKLVDGARRIAAFIDLGRGEIEARIEPEQALADDIAVRLAEIKGHLLRGALTALEHAISVSAWCDVFQDVNGAPKRGRKPKSPDLNSQEEIGVACDTNWSAAAQEALGISRSVLFRCIKIARIDADIRSRIALHPIAEVQRELLLLSELTPVRQKAVVDLLTSEPAEAATVTEALALLDHAPGAKPVPAYERLYDRFTRLKAPEKEAFFDLNADAIDAWIAKRAAKNRRAA
ncbi:hypothetical protein E3C22_16500 [Jiella endophytica]|uniref:ParB-like N-terminal domain-containing protein n=1 Tax=Jiella endophytica TaxID=2558362 RepID=A0A4Y8RET8_9HYPH|nr:ParB N-terminal domain-containing protein [Jiella endophytica]TFF20509.1 hypothetical protein E3C22_16500 [Jiella endophytica]